MEETPACKKSSRENQTPAPENLTEEPLHFEAWKTEKRLSVVLDPFANDSTDYQTSRTRVFFQHLVAVILALRMFPRIVQLLRTAMRQADEHG